MKKPHNKKAYFAVVSIIVILSIAFSFGYWLVEQDDYSKQIHLLGAKLFANISGETTINITNAVPIDKDSYIGEADYIDFSINGFNNTIEGCYSMKINVINISNVLKTKYFKWVLYDLDIDDAVNYGDFSTVSNGSSLEIINYLDLLKTTNDNYRLYIYFENDEEINQTDMINESSFQAKIVTESRNNNCTFTATTYTSNSTANPYYRYPITKTGYYEIELQGAQGGTGLNNGAGTYIGGMGTYASGKIHLSLGDNIYIYVGSPGGNANGSTGGTAGYNGGGIGGNDDDDDSAGGGGGATDIRYFESTPSTDDLMWNSSLGLNSRIMVAAGGTGSDYYRAGNPGGTLTGDNGNYVVTNSYGYGGTQKLYNFGIGAAGYFCSTDNGGIAGGGGGYYGGLPGKCDAPYGLPGSSSSYISGYAGVNSVNNNGVSTNGTLHYSGKYSVNGAMNSSTSGSAHATIKFVSKKPERVNTNLNNVRYIKDCVYNIGNTTNYWYELQTIKDGINVAKGKLNVIFDIATNTIVNATSNAATDGRIESPMRGSTVWTGSQCLIIDLNKAYDLDEIAVWHNWVASSHAVEHELYVSSDNVIWTKILETNESPTSQGYRVTAYDN